MLGVKCLGTDFTVLLNMEFHISISVCKTMVVTRFITATWNHGRLHLKEMCTLDGVREPI